MKNYTVMFRETGVYTAWLKITGPDMETAFQNAKDQFGYTNNGRTSFCIWAASD